MTVGDKGVAIVINAGGYNLTSSTLRLLAQPGEPPYDLGVGIALTGLTISADGLSATYKTTGEDFLIGGPWQLQLEVTTQTGQVFTSPPEAIFINLKGAA